jgi:hypothetical protein
MEEKRDYKQEGFHENWNVMCGNHPGYASNPIV